MRTKEVQKEYQGQPGTVGYPSEHNQKRSRKKKAQMNVIMQEEDKMKGQADYL